MNVTYHNDDRGKSGETVTGYLAYDQEDHTPSQVAALYSKRSTIEKSYEKFREAQAPTTTPSPLNRLLYVAVGFLLE